MAKSRKIEIEVKRDRRGTYFAIDIDPEVGAVGAFQAARGLLPGYRVVGFDRKRTKAKMYVEKKGEPGK